jgi:hypothetical protein
MTARPSGGKGDPPHVGPRPTPYDMLRAVAAHGLHGSRCEAVLPPADGPWRELVALAERQRVLGLLVAVAVDGGLPPDDPRLVDLLDLHRQWCAHDLRLERLLVVAADRLDAEGIDLVVLKGPALAHRHYPDPSQRLFGDLDLLVPSGQVVAASAALSSALEAVPELPELRPGFDDRFGKEVLLRTAPSELAPGGYEIDVHRTIIAGALGLTIPLDELFQATGELELGGRRLATLGPLPLLLATCYQAAISDSPPRLASSRDLAQVVLGTPVTVDELLAAARRWRATAVVTAAFTRTWSTLELADHPLVVGWLAVARPTRLERLLLTAHVAPGHVYWRHLAALLVLPGLEPRARYLRALVTPQASYLAGRTSSRSDHASRSWRSLSRPVREPLVRTGRRIRRRVRPLP